MTKKFTQDDIIRYIYGETSRNENKLVEVLLATDWEFREAYQQLLKLKNDLDLIAKTPSERVISNILKFSKTYRLPTFEQI